MIRTFLVVAFLLGAVSSAMAERLPFHFGIATSDPFASEGQEPPRNGILLFGGLYTLDDMNRSLFWRMPTHTGQFLAGGAYSRDLFELPGGFIFGAEAGLAARFGRSSRTSGELWSAFKLRHHGLVLGDAALSPGITLGLSAVTGRLAIEAEREARSGGTSTLLAYFSPEIALRFNRAPNMEIVYRLQHRSGAFGLLGGMTEGANASTIGVRWRY
jgi:hypothetical protein